MLIYVLLYICIIINLICLIKLYFIIKNIFELKKKLLNNNCIIIHNKPIRNHIYKLTLVIFAYICDNYVFDINEHDDIIKKIKKYNTCNIILNTTGGNISSNDTLINFILTSKVNLNIYILNKAMSAGTLIALSANNLYIDKDAYLSPTDPQIPFDDDMYSIKSFIDLYENKDNNYITDKYLITYYENKKLYDENINLIQKLLKNKFRKNISKNKKKEFINILTSGKYAHHYPLFGSYINNFLDIHLNLPKTILEIHKLYNMIIYYT